MLWILIDFVVLLCFQQFLLYGTLFLYKNHESQNLLVMFKLGVERVYQVENQLEKRRLGSETNIEKFGQIKEFSFHARKLNTYLN